MRLSGVLSKPPSREYVQVDSFLLDRRGTIGQQVELEIGNIMLNYFCSECEDNRTFTSQGKIFCVFVNKQIISIDCVLACGCGANTQAWFLVECDDDIREHAPKVRILKRTEKLSNMVKINSNRFGEFSALLDMAEHAYRESLGAGSIVYLRKAFEKITMQIANSAGIEYAAYAGGNPKNFHELLKKVDEQLSIIPKEFSSDGYRLFRELSSVVHGEYDEELGLRKFEPLHRLVVGILENVKNKEELHSAIGALGWNDNGGTGHE